MKKIVLLSMILLTTGFSKDLFELGFEAYNKGEFDKAAKQWQKACDDNVARACHNLGILYEDAEGVKQDYHKAAELYKRSCDGGFVGSCLNLGVLYIKDQVVEQDYSKAINLYKKACDGDVAQACHNLGVLYALGKGVNQDYRLAKRYVFKACTLGFQDGCDYLNKMIDSNATDDNDEKIEIIFKTMSKTINHLKQIE